MKRLTILLLLLLFHNNSKAQSNLDELYGEWANYREVSDCGYDNPPLLETSLKVEPYSPDTILLTLTRDGYEDEEYYSVIQESTLNEGEFLVNAYFEEYYCFRKMILTHSDSLFVESLCACLACWCGGDYFFVKSSDITSNVDREVENWRIQPNPVLSNVIVTAPDFEDKNAEIRIYNSIGNLVQLVPVSSKQNFIDLAALRTGIYYIEIQYDDTRIVEKIIKI